MTKFYLISLEIYKKYVYYYYYYYFVTIEIQCVILYQDDKK